MKMLLFAGLLLVVLGIAFLVVPIPRSESQGIKVGDTNIGVQTSHNEPISVSWFSAKTVRRARAQELAIPFPTGQKETVNPPSGI